MMNEEDRLVAAIKGDKIAASNPKFWFMLQKIKEDNNDYQYYTSKTAEVQKWIKEQIKGE